MLLLCYEARATDTKRYKPTQALQDYKEVGV